MNEGMGLVEEFHPQDRNLGVEILGIVISWGLMKVKYAMSI